MRRLSCVLLVLAACALTFTNVTLGGTPLSGTATFSTTDTTSFTLDANLTGSTTTFVVTGFSVAGSSGAVTFGGSVAISGDASTSISFGSVLWKDGDCYPSSGAITVQKGAISESIAFSATTPTTGQVVVTVGKKSVPVSLPAYGSCG